MIVFIVLKRRVKERDSSFVSPPYSMQMQRNRSDGRTHPVPHNLHRVGRGSVIERAIIDKNVRIGENVVIRARADARDLKGDLCWVRDRITVIPKGTIIPFGTEL